MSITTLVSRQRVVGVKAETTIGTAETPAAADAKTVAYDPKIKYNVQVTKRPSPGSASQFASLPGSESGQATYKTFLHGLGSAGNPEWATWLLSCGLTNTAGVFTPITSPANATAQTIALYQAGRLKRLAGCAGTAVFKMKVGEPVSVEWNWTGKRIAPSNASLLTPTYNATKPPVLLGSAITLASVQYKISELQFDLGAKVTLVEDVSDATGYAYALVTDREPKITGVKLMATTAKDFHADFVAGTQAAFSAQVGTASNNTITFAAPNAQLMEEPDDEDSNGYLLDTLGFQLNKNSDAGDDEYSITFA